MLESAVGVMHVSVQNDRAILSDMGELYRHRLDWSIEDARIVNIVPSEEQAGSSIELVKLLFPELARVLIQEVHEG